MYFKKCYLTVKVIFLNDRFYSAGNNCIRQESLEEEGIGAGGDRGNAGGVGSAGGMTRRIGSAGTGGKSAVSEFRNIFLEMAFLYLTCKTSSLA